MNVVDGLATGIATASMCVIFWNLWRNWGDPKPYWFWNMIADLMLLASNWLHHNMTLCVFWAFFVVWSYKNWKDHDDDDDPWKWKKIKEVASKIARPVFVPVRNYT